MTFKTLTQIIKKNNIPNNVKLLSDSGWECSETDMDGVYYNKIKNEIIFTQNRERHYDENKDFLLLYNKKDKYSTYETL